MTSNSSSGTGIGAGITDPFVQFNIDASTNFLELTDQIRQRSGIPPCKEVRLSIESSLIDASQERQKHRETEFMVLLKILLSSEPEIEKFTVDSGNVCETNALPLEALATILTHAQALKRIDLSYIEITANHLDEFENFTNILEEANLESRHALRQCCFDRSTLAMVSPAFIQPNNQPEERQKLGLDLLVKALIHNFRSLEWLTICSDDYESLLTPDTMTMLCQAPNLQELAFYNFNFQQEHLVAMFNGLSENPSRLVRLTIPGTFTWATTLSVCEHLRQSRSLGGASLEGLTLTVNQFAKEENHVHTKQEREECTMNILRAFASALSVNESLQSFRLRGSTKISGRYKYLFRDMLYHNVTLCYFSILNPQVTGEETGSGAEDMIQMYLKLNRHGRAHLLKSENVNKRERWVDALIELRNDIDCLYYLLSTNPLLCD